MNGAVAEMDLNLELCDDNSTDKNYKTLYNLIVSVDCNADKIDLNKFAIAAAELINANAGDARLTQIRTGIAGFRVQSANHYTMRPHDSAIIWVSGLFDSGLFDRGLFDSGLFDSTGQFDSGGRFDSGFFDSIDTDRAALVH
uniref:Uncharacterized protein n=1 Tax=Globodera rostochiensis TaxID=31243 RepID=A0A914HYU5_GLORO